MRTYSKLKTFLITVLAVGIMSAVSVAMEPTLTWLGHAAFQYTTRNGQVILIDPWLSNPKAPKKFTLKRVDAILVTHGHSDHAGEAFELAKKYDASLVASFELSQLAAKHGVKKILPINPSGTVEIAGIKVTAVEAIHSSSYTDGDVMLYAGAPVGFIVEEYGSATLYHAGDTGLFESMALIGRLYQPQIAMLPVGGIYTMKPLEAARAAQLLTSKTIIPMHYGTFPALTGTPAELKTEMAHLGLTSHVTELEPGKAHKIKDLL
jgi:L-ascorbate metabolism protein UlaG (beta-lactamase superfamily)